MITVYSKANCPQCNNAKALLTSYGIEYIEEKIDENPEARDFLLGEGHKSVPQMYNGHNLVCGFNDLTQMSKEELIEKVNA